MPEREADMSDTDDAPSGMVLPRYTGAPETPSRGQPPVDHSEGQAVGALICALIPSVVTNLIGIGLAIAVLNKPYGGRFNGRGKAIAALVIAPIWLVVTVSLLVWSGSSDTERDDDETAIESGRVSVDALRVGDCLESLDVDPSVGIASLRPTQRSWDDDRSVTCLVTSEEPVTGPARDAAG